MIVITSVIHNPRFAIINREKIAKWTIISRSLAKNKPFGYRILFTRALNLSREYRIRNPLAELRKTLLNVAVYYKISL